MKYGVAVWNWHSPPQPLPEFIAELMSEGFQAIAVQPREILGLDDQELTDVLILLDEHAMPVTVHASAADFPAETMQALLGRLGNRFHAVTFDGIMVPAPSGRRWDAATMAQTLQMVDRLGAEVGVRFGIEDFPIDAEAMTEFAADLAPVRGNPRWGMLVDLGHLNLRRHTSKYFGDRSLTDNIRCLPVTVHELHIHDNDGTRDVHMPLGTGTLDFAEAARALREVGFDGIATIEVCPGLHGRRPAEVWQTRAESLNRWREAWEG